MFETLQLASVTKYFDFSRAASDAPAQAHAEEYQPLDPNADDGTHVPQEGETEMGRGFNDQFEKPEERHGDAIAQIVAIVSRRWTRTVVDADHRVHQVSVGVRLP